MNRRKNWGQIFSQLLQLQCGTQGRRVICVEGCNLSCRRWKWGRKHRSSQLRRSLCRRSTSPILLWQRQEGCVLRRELGTCRAGCQRRALCWERNQRTGCTACVAGWAFRQGLHCSTKSFFIIFFKLPPCFSPTFIVSEVFCCFQVLACLLSSYCVNFKG